MSARIRSEPDWTGRWIYLQMLPPAAIASISRSDMSWGWEVVKRTRRVLSTEATAVIRSAKSYRPSR